MVKLNSARFQPNFHTLMFSWTHSRLRWSGPVDQVCDLNARLSFETPTIVTRSAFSYDFETEFALHAPARHQAGVKICTSLLANTTGNAATAPVVTPFAV